MRITVKRDDPSAGPARWRNHQRGGAVRIDGKRIGNVAWVQIGNGRSGWYYAVGDHEHGVPYASTTDALVGTFEEVKSDVLAYVKTHARVLSRFRVAIPVSGTLITEVYASSPNEACEKGQTLAKSIAVVPSAPAVAWHPPGVGFATEVEKS